MPGVISAALLRFLPWIVGVLLALDLFVYILHEHAALRQAEHDFAAARDTVAQLEDTNSKDLDALKRLQRTAAAWQVAQTEVAAQDARRATDARQMLDAIATSAAVSSPRLRQSPDLSTTTPTDRVPGKQGSPMGPTATAAETTIPEILVRTLDSIAAAQATNQFAKTVTPQSRTAQSAPNRKKPFPGANQ